MRTIMRHVGLVIALVIFTTTISHVSFAQNQRFTRRLPRIDKVELQKVSAREIGIDHVVASREIKGADAQRIARLWRGQHWSRMGFACHQPGYALKFIWNGKMLFYASVCWDCHNVY